MAFPGLGWRRGTPTGFRLQKIPACRMPGCILKLDYANAHTHTVLDLHTKTISVPRSAERQKHACLPACSLPPPHHEKYFFRLSVRLSVDSLFYSIY